MAKGPNITALYDKILKLQDTISKAREIANDLITDAGAFNGEVARVIPGQVKQFLLTSLDRISDDAQNPGSIISLINFIEALPVRDIMGMAKDMGAPQAPQENSINSTLPEGYVRAENGKQYFRG
jgi:hypothetical protein